MSQYHSIVLIFMFSVRIPFLALEFLEIHKSHRKPKKVVAFLLPCDITQFDSCKEANRLSYAFVSTNAGHCLEFPPRTPPTHLTAMRIPLLRSIAPMLLKAYIYRFSYVIRTLHECWESNVTR